MFVTATYTLKKLYTKQTINIDIVRTTYSCQYILAQASLRLPVSGF